MKDTSGSGGTFTLDVIVPTPTTLDFASMPATGQTLSPEGEALYEITGLTPGVIYSVSKTGNNANQLNVYDDPSFSNFLCFAVASTGGGNCNATPSGTSLFLRVKNGSGLGVTFTLDVIVAPP